MPPIIALLFGFGFVGWLLRREAAACGKMPRHLWVPFIWLLIQGSRPVTGWFGLGGTELGGNPIEAGIAFSLYLSAFIILQRRGYSISVLPTLNVALTLLFAYFLVSCAWSAYPFVAFKRWTKELGTLFIVLVILTEADPATAFKMLGVRCAHVLFPISVVLYKYYPKFGRDFSMAGGEMITGVTPQKNTLGMICALFGLVLIWDLLDQRAARRNGNPVGSTKAKWISLGIGVWLLIASESKTSLLSFAVGLIVFLGTYLPVIRRSSGMFARLFVFGTIAGLVVAAFWTTQVAPLLEAMGRDASFTDRTNIWQLVLNLRTDPIIGTGFYSFWIGPGLALQEKLGGIALTSAHSGYLELYLDGGAVACALLGLFLLSTFSRLAACYAHERPFARAMLACAIMCLIMNFSESYFFRLGTVWFALELGALVSREYLASSTAPEAVQGTPVLAPA
jgi:O-antigen ligase